MYNVHCDIVDSFVDTNTALVYSDLYYLAFNFRTTTKLTKQLTTVPLRLPPPPTEIRRT